VTAREQLFSFHVQADRYTDLLLPGESNIRKKIQVTIEDT